MNREKKGAKRITSQCQPPRPTAFLTTPCNPTNTDFVLLFPVTITLVCLGSTESSSSPLSSRKGDRTREEQNSGSSILVFSLMIPIKQNRNQPQIARKHKTANFIPFQRLKPLTTALNKPISKKNKQHS